MSNKETNEAVEAFMERFYPEVMKRLKEYNAEAQKKIRSYIT